MPHLNAFLDACRLYQGGEPEPSLRQLGAGFICEAPQDLALLVRAAGQLSSPTLPPHGVAWLAIVIGTCIERNPDLAVHTGPPLLAVFQDWLSQLPREEPQEDEETEVALTPEQATQVEALPLLSRALVAHLARLPTMRQALADDGAWLAQLDQQAHHSHAILWVLELLKRRSGTLVLLHPQSGQGAVVRYENVSNCFHLFSLIQAEVGERLPGGRAPDEKIAAAARGDDRGLLHDHAWWHYGDPRSPSAELSASVWGESSVTSIPVIRGVQVLLLWPCLLNSRSWNSGFFTPQIDAAPPSLTWVAPLSAEAWADWALVLGLPSPP